MLKLKKTVLATALRPQSKLALVAPAFTFNKTLMSDGRAMLQSKYNLETCFLESVYEQDSYFAGSDERRLGELYHWLTNPDVDGLIAIRGGYGCARIYPELIKKLRKHRNLKPKVVVGYSDLTILLNGLHQDLGWITFHGPVVVSRVFREPVVIEDETFRKSLFTDEPLGEITDAITITVVPGIARGKIVGGCLSLVAASIGTSYEIQTDGHILFLEDVTEKPYRLDRLATHLLHAGKLDKVRGVVFGQMTDCGAPGEALAALRSALEPFLRKKKIPTIFNFPAGHGNPQITFPIGAKVELIAREGEPCVRFLEAGVRCD